LTNLILVPTPLELERLQSKIHALKGTNFALQLCGFGPIAAAARASNLISRYQPERVLLIGIAGTFDANRYPIGSAQRFTRTVCYGVGVGVGKSHHSAAQMGWLQFTGADAQPEIGDTLPLDSGFVSGIPASGTLLTCCSSSDSAEEAESRRQLFPDAAAEDMEGFSVAMACNLAGVPLQIVRGISNEVGNRNMGDWQIDEAMESAAKLATRLMQRAWLPSQS
jgi:futalosine hydrolase|tara:strand:+ start:2178 stop:2846 length:669 start_codon:yes stop_codon:yes gene_type:complete